MRFLENMRTDRNISLFHYRNHGADHGRVLVGMQVPRREMPQFRKFLATLGYPYVDESGNPPTGCSWAELQRGSVYGCGSSGGISPK